MKEVVLELSGLSAPDLRLHRRMPRIEARMRSERARVFRSVFRALGRAVAAPFRAIQRWNTEAKALGEVARLDDRMLRDIGLERADLRAAVRYGLRGPHAASRSAGTGATGGHARTIDTHWRDAA